MAADDRSVRHLRLRAADAAGVHRGARLIEDALRCASLAESGHRLVLVRRLVLGVLPERLSSQSLALRIERAWGRRSGGLVHGGERWAGGAGAVWFRDAVDAHLCLGLRLAEGVAPGEWYWPLAVGGYDAGSAPRAALRGVLISLAGRETARVAVPAWVAGMAAAGRVQAVAEAIEAGDVGWLRERTGLTGRGAVAASAAAFLDEADGAPQRSARGDASESLEGMRVEGGDAAPGPGTAHAPGASGSEAAGRVWAFVLDALEAAGTPPASVGIASTAAIGRIARRRALVETPPPAGKKAGPAEPYAATDPRAPRVDALLGATPTPAADAELASEPAQQPPTVAPREAARPWRESTFRPTQAAGLLFLVPVLARLGYAEWAAEHLPPRRQAAAARKLWWQLLTSLDVAPEDPSWQLAADSRESPEWLAGAEAAFRAIGAAAQRSLPADPLASGAPSPTADLRAHSAASPLADSPAAGAASPSADPLAASAATPPTHPLATGAATPPADPLAAAAASPPADPLAPSNAASPPADPLSLCAAAWLHRCRRWLRLRAGIGPASLVLRPGAIDLSATHADLLFDLRDADLRVRRAGLDLDPGWVPWLGRVVSFHYERGVREGAE